MDFGLAYRRYSLPFRGTVRTAHGPWSRREGLLVRIEGSDGRVGWGEAAPVAGFGTETVDEEEAFCRGLMGRLGPEAMAAVPERLGALRFAFSSALADPPVPLAGRSLGVAALLPAGRQALLEAPPKAEAGFRVFKWKVGVGRAEEELPLFDDLVAALPGGSRLRLDANGSWDRRTSERWLARAAESPVEHVEQPVSPGSRRADDLLLGLAADFPTPIALDESVAGHRDIERWLGLGWRGIFVVKPSLLGDPAGALARLASARARVVFSSALETAMGARNALRVAFSWTGEARALGFGVWPLFADSAFDGPAAAPFLSLEDVERIRPEDLWNALS
jgi:O-succinylbenzoate synthase